MDLYIFFFELYSFVSDSSFPFFGAHVSLDSLSNPNFLLSLILFSSIKQFFYIYNLLSSDSKPANCLKCCIPSSSMYFWQTSLNRK
jgi:hypothetical protein